MSDFVHLHVHTEYSLLEGAVRIDDLIRTACEWGMSAVAMTDTNSLYGAIGFYTKALKAGIRPILGVQLSVLYRSEEELSKESAAQHGLIPRDHPALDTVVLLAENVAGYQSLVKLVTMAQARSPQPYVLFSELIHLQSGLFALIGGGESTILRLLVAGQPEQAGAYLASWSASWQAGRVFLDLQDHALPEERRGLPSLVEWARECDVPLIATNDVHYLTREDAPVQQILASMEGATGRKLVGDRYEFSPVEEMERRFAKIPEALDNATLLAERCRVELPLGETLLPKYPTQGGEEANEVLHRAAYAGVQQRYGSVPSDVDNRLQYELEVIANMGFADYFLVVADFIRFAHKQGISTGPGRGSAAGSLVAYALRITDVDPLKYNLTFERFLNPERVSWPDIDTDFEFERRGEVIQYVVERYGRNFVAQIGTFGTFAAKASIRDAGRALGIDGSIVDKMARLIPSYPGVTLEGAKQEVADLARLIQSGTEAERLWLAAVSIEGLPRHTSVHAAGVVISPVPLDSLVPVQSAGDGTPVTQYAMDDIERIGLIKMDFLGLRTLSLIDETVRLIESRTGESFDWRRVSEEDPPTYAMLSKGESDGCFQLESSGMRRVLRDFRPSKLEDLIALVSLYRPGPMENIPVFVSAKHGKTKPQYLHPDLEPILRDTYGVIVYQEQIMQIAAVMGGFSLGQADLLRRAVSKKKREVLDAERSRFVAGCQSRGYTLEVANDVYDLIVRFADYGFNRAHAAAYAVLAFRTAFLRANYFSEFLCALLSMHYHSPEKASDYERDAKRHGVRILPPSVNDSQRDYTVDADGNVRRGLLSIRNVGRAAVEAILTAKSEAPFQSMVDFLTRVNQRACNRKTVESLLAVGAMDEFFPTDATQEMRLQLLEEAYVGAQTGGFERALFGTKESSPGTLYIRLGQALSNRGTLVNIKQVVQTYPGPTRVALFDATKRKTRLLDVAFSVQVTPELIGSLEEIVGIGNARLGKLGVPDTGRSHG